MSVLTLTDANFQREVLESEQPVLVDFTAEWCPPCKAIAPVIEALATEYAGRAKLGKLDVDVNVAVAGRYGIRSMPTLLVFKGGKIVDQVIGAVPRHKIAATIDKALA